MKERPILFSAPMVRAILSGTKTQTRRVVKPTRGRPIEFLGCGPRGGADWNNPECWGYIYHDDDYQVLLKPDSADPFSRQYPCPYGQPGERLWVRESFQADPPIDSTWHSTAWHGCPEHAQLSEIPERYRVPKHCIYRASWTGSDLTGWRPSIHMPRWASRITLEVTGVRVERLQDISEADALAEGIEPDRQPQDRAQLWRNYATGNTTICPVHSYHTLWESINGAGSWDANPWVWCVSFKRLIDEVK